MEGREVETYGTGNKVTLSHFSPCLSLPYGGPSTFYIAGLITPVHCYFSVTTWMNSFSCTGTGDSKQDNILGQCLHWKESSIQLKKCQGPQDEDALQENTAWWSFSLTHVLSVPKSVTLTGLVFSSCILMGLHYWLVCAIAKPQVSSMQFWYILLPLCFIFFKIWIQVHHTRVKWKQTHLWPSWPQMCHISIFRYLHSKSI